MTRPSVAAAGIAPIIGSAALVFGVISRAANVPKCGKERWPVKTLTDGPDAAKVDLAHPIKTTVEELRRLDVPKAWTDTAPRLPPVETHTYRVNVLLMSMKKEETDSDIHLVIVDPKVGGSMIAEFPLDACTTGTSTTSPASDEARALMKQARADIAAACGGEPAKKFVTLSGKATITGVGFFDRIHKQGGVAPNGIELHPVIKFENATCQRVKP